jgi:hypothetical protein
METPAAAFANLFATFPTVRFLDYAGYDVPIPIYIAQEL